MNLVSQGNNPFIGLTCPRLGDSHLFSARKAESPLRFQLDDIQGDTVAIGAHGISPQLEKEIRARQIDIIDTTCRFVHRAQAVAASLAKSGFFVVISAVA